MSKTKTPRTPTELRESRGLTLIAAASGCGVASTALAKVEAGAWGVTVATLERVARFYGVTLTALVAGCEQARAS
jgi:transcriptional regulator with XRE-family HTH domain